MAKLIDEMYRYGSMMFTNPQWLSKDPSIQEVGAPGLVREGVRLVGGRVSCQGWNR